MRLVVALGGNALLRRGETMDVETQRANVKSVSAVLADLAQSHDIVVTHGNGPQVGLLALQATAYPEVSPYPLDVLDAESEGMIGYLLEQAIASEAPGADIAVLLTQVEVDPADPAFRRPTKPIGPVYDEATARSLAASRGWLLGRDGAGYRRLVPSPEPRRIIELATIARLTAGGAIVVCAGGGGIPVFVDSAGAVRGVEAVVDKDLTAALLARELDADALLLLTDVAGVWTEWGSPRSRLVAEIDPSSLRELRLQAGSMGPKAEAACRFVDATRRQAFIGPMTAAAEVLAGRAGTKVWAGAALTCREDGRGDGPS